MNDATFIVRIAQIVQIAPNHAKRLILNINSRAFTSISVAVVSLHI